MSGKKVLVIRYKPLKGFIQSIPAFAAIRKQHKNDEITILTEKSMIKICKRAGLFDKVWLDEKPEWFNPAGILDLMKRLRSAKFDVVYDLQNDKRSEWYFRLFGFKKPLWNSSVLDWCSHPYINRDWKVMSQQDLLHEQLKVIGIKATPLIDISYMQDTELKEPLPEKFAMICSAGDKAKIAHKWDPVGYAEVLDNLYEKYGINAVLVGDNEDDFWINGLVAQQCIKAKPVNYSGKTSIPGIISVAKKAIFCLGNDTAPTHIAAYAGCKTIMICSRFSPAELVLPKVNNVAVIEEQLLENVTVERVMSAVEQFGLSGGDKSAIKSFTTAGEGILTQPEIVGTKNETV